MITDKLSMLSDSEQAVVQTITMRLNLRESISYLKDAGFDISERTYYRYKRKVESLKWQRLMHISNLFTDQHLQRMDKLELIEQLMWKEYHQEKPPAKRVSILFSSLQLHRN